MYCYSIFTNKTVSVKIIVEFFIMVVSGKMFSKRIAICLYRGINKQAGIVQSCYGCITQRNVFVRTWSDDRTNVSTVKTCQGTNVIV